MPDRADFDRLLAAHRYLVLGTVGADGRPWATPVFFAPLGADAVCWVSSPDSRHSHNVESRPSVALTVFDSTVAVGGAQAAYADAEARRARPDELADVLDALDARLPAAKRLVPDDLRPAGPLVAYRADLQHRYVLVRGGDPEQGNAVDMTLEV